MPRPTKCRKVCHLPVNSEFIPARTDEQDNKDVEAIVLSVDEYEAIRLIDKEGFSQEQCSDYMRVARTTAQQIYNNARKKIAIALVDGRAIEIRGGQYTLCDGKEKFCGCGGCKKHSGNKKSENKDEFKEYGGNTMRIAVTYDNGEVFGHFGHTEQFKLYDVNDGKVANSEIIDTNGSGHGALAGFLVDNRVDTLICGGIGGGAQMALAEAGIKLYGGVSGEADAAVNALISGNLAYDENVHCDHHDHENGEGGHSCSEHGCGSHR